MPLPGRGRPLKRSLGRDSETRKPLHTPPPMPAVGASAQSSVSLLRLKAQKRLQLRQRMGLLKHKNADEDLSDVERKMLDHELAIAEELQANLLPRKVPQIPGYDVSAYYRPSREVGGDYYDFIEIDADHLGILVADVSGKGIPGSIVMTETRALVKSEAVRTLSPAETLTRVNRVLYTDGVIESMNRNNEQFGQNRFYLRVKQLADKSSSEFLSLLVSELEAHQGDAPQHDDITIVTGRT